MSRYQVAGKSSARQIFKVISETIASGEFLKIALDSSIKMTITRIFNSANFLQPADGEPIRSVVTESQEAVIVAWIIQPGQKIPAHIHPQGQDTWTILTGKGEYYLDIAGTTQPIAAGDVVIAHPGCVHGVFNTGDEPLVFISVVSPANAGYQLVSLDSAAAIHS